MAGVKIISTMNCLIIIGEHQRSKEMKGIANRIFTNIKKRAFIFVYLWKDVRTNSIYS